VGPVDLPLPGKEVQRGDGLLLIRPDPGPLGMCGEAILLSVCQAMSIAITTVLPEPVAIFSAARCKPRLC
jgi:hypothetical protein